MLAIVNSNWVPAGYTVVNPVTKMKVVGFVTPPPMLSWQVRLVDTTPVPGVQELAAVEELP